jgi:hypothetical protein
MKWLIRIVLVIVVLLVITVLGGFMYVDVIARRGVEHGATYALGVETKLAKADVGIFSGTFDMKGLNVANPEGFQSPHFLNLGTGGVDVTLPSLRKETVELTRLNLGDLDVNLERRGGKSNYDVILDNLRKLESGEKPPEKSGSEKRFIVREIDITDVNIHFDMLPEGGELTKVDVPIDAIRLTDVGSDTDKGVLLADLSGVIIKAIMAAAVQKGGDLIPPDMLKDLRTNLGKLNSLADMGIGVVSEIDGKVQDLTGTIDEIAGDLNGGVKGAEKGIKDAGKQLEDATKGIGDILGGGKKKEGGDGG